MVNGKDCLIWSKSQRGEYTVSKAYSTLWHDCNTSTPNSLNFPWQEFGKLKVPPRFMLFIWTLLHQAIPFSYVLKHHGVGSDGSCVFCHEVEESLDHLFLTCDFAKCIRFSSELTIRTGHINPNSITYWLECLFN